MTLHLASTSRILALPGEIRLRREHFGGIVFDARTGTTVEVDREAMSLLLAIRMRGAVREDGLAELPPDETRQRISSRVISGIVKRLLHLGVLVEAAPPFPAPVDGKNPLSDWPAYPALTAPETVHWAVTYACDAGCPDCYARRFRGMFETELSPAEALQVVDRLAAWDIFQLALGGGEPLQRPDLPAITRRAREQGLVVHVTTGFHRVPEELLRALAGNVTVLQIGLKADRLLEDPGVEIATLSATIAGAASVGITVHANLMLSKTVLANFAGLMHAVSTAGFSRLTLLRYKPPAEISRWLEENPETGDLRPFEAVLRETAVRYPQVALRLDCALSFLQRRLDPAVAREAGIRGCVAADRIIALGPDGSFFPCSQLVHPRFRAGNILADDFAARWHASPILNEFRNFRENAAFRTTHCGRCLACAFCGGCRALSYTAWDGDPGCLGPRMPPGRLPGQGGDDENS